MNTMNQWLTIATNTEIALKSMIAIDRQTDSTTLKARLRHSHLSYRFDILEAFHLNLQLQSICPIIEEIIFD